MLRRILLIAVLAATMLASLLPVTSADARSRTARKKVVPTREQGHAELQRVQATFSPNLGPGRRELTTRLAALRAAYPNLSDADKLAARRFFARPDDAAVDDTIEYGANESVDSPYCPVGGNFCIHWTDQGGADDPDLTDAGGDPVPDYVETMYAEFENVYTVENTTMGWRVPDDDGDGMLDVFIGDIGGFGLYGYAVPEENTRISQGYMVMDNDYSEFLPTAPLDALKVTAAHEYAHILQFAYDAGNQTWFLESTSTWMEEQVYPAINDYVNYMEAWGSFTRVSMLKDDNDASSLHRYGSNVLHHYIEADFVSDDVIRDSWERGRADPVASLGSVDYGTEVESYVGGNMVSELGGFYASTTEWVGYPDALPDVERMHTLHINGQAVVISLDALSFELMDLDPYDSDGFGVIVPTKVIFSAPALGYASFGFGHFDDSVFNEQHVNTENGGKFALPLTGVPNQYIDGDPNPSVDDNDRITVFVGSSEWINKTFDGFGPVYYDNQIYSARATTDFTQPNTTITRMSGTGRTRAFRFVSNQAGSTFLCKMDSKAFAACTSGKTYRSLSRGRHKFQVKAKDVNLNQETTPGVKSFRIS